MIVFFKTTHTHSHSLANQSVLWLATRYTAYCQPLKLGATYGVLATIVTLWFIGL
jgi:hypothetical protein